MAGEPEIQRLNGARGNSDTENSAIVGPAHLFSDRRFASASGDPEGAPGGRLPYHVALAETSRAYSETASFGLQSRELPSAFDQRCDRGRTIASAQRLFGVAAPERYDGPIDGRIERDVKRAVMACGTEYAV